MTLPVVPDYKPWDIEKSAQDFLSQYWSPREQWVDIETIIERDLDVLIDYSACDCFGTIGTIGRRQSDNRLVIIVSEEIANRNPNRYRFTLAQEVGHLLLHKGILESIATLEDALDFHNSLTRKQYEQLEYDANWCAGSILMPQHQFRDAVFDAYELWFGKIGTHIGKMSPDFLVKRVIDELAKRYRVSSQAARIRLQRYPIRLYDDIFESARRSQPYISTSDT